MRKMRMMAAAGALSLALCGLSAAAEHPHEHPQEHPTAGHKAGGHPQADAKKAAETKQFQEDYEKVVQDYVKAESAKTGGVFTVKDDAAKKDWQLKLVRVHKSKICMLDQGKNCFACADFQEVNGKAKLDLDFYAEKSAAGKIGINKVIIHKVNGKPRFTYDQKNQMVPAK